jgi:hypothetical protein|tara:strand:- start:316 stop:537 length:222 start_codon:yes stop_codon:yes gene_type:complete
MTKAAELNDFISKGTQKETALDKTTRIVRVINEDEAEVRQMKTLRLRKARFESEENLAGEPVTTASNTSKKRR